MIHKEGYPSIAITIIFVAVLNLFVHFYLPFEIVKLLVYAISIFLLVMILQFFRNPNRTITIDENGIIAPADGKVVVIEEVYETEYFKDKRLQISIFMSPLNVHVNRFPIGGIVKYMKYHRGLYLVAWHPKSSAENEMTTIVVKHKNHSEILFRQIAGAMARRIVCYCKESDSASQGEEMGFIKFGSRVDILLPLTVKVNVKLEENVKGGMSILAKF